MGLQSMLAHNRMVDLPKIAELFELRVIMDVLPTLYDPRGNPGFLEPYHKRFRFLRGGPARQQTIKVIFIFFSFVNARESRFP